MAQGPWRRRYPLSPAPVRRSAVPAVGRAWWELCPMCTCPVRRCGLAPTASGRLPSVLVGTAVGSHVTPRVACAGAARSGSRRDTQADRMVRARCAFSAEPLPGPLRPLLLRKPEAARTALTRLYGSSVRPEGRRGRREAAVSHVPLSTATGWLRCAVWFIPEGGSGPGRAARLPCTARSGDAGG